MLSNLRLFFKGDFFIRNTGYKIKGFPARTKTELKNEAKGGGLPKALEFFPKKRAM